MSVTEILSIISLGSYIFAAICLIVAVIIWFKFKIPIVFGDLSGLTAKKSIERMRAFNEKTGNKTFESSEINEKRGKLTSNMQVDVPKSKRQLKKSIKYDNETQLLAIQNEVEQIDLTTQPLLDDESTTLLKKDTFEDISSVSNDFELNSLKKIDMKIIEQVMLVDSKEVIE